MIRDQTNKGKLIVLRNLEIQNSDFSKIIESFDVFDEFRNFDVLTKISMF